MTVIPLTPGKPLQANLAYWRLHFPSLSGWDITFAADDASPGGSSINAETRTAVIFEWRGEGDQPHDYVLHELLHIAFAEATRSPQDERPGCPRSDCKCESEERVVQDLCDLLTMGM